MYVSPCVSYVSYFVLFYLVYVVCVCLMYPLKRQHNIIKLDTFHHFSPPPNHRGKIWVGRRCFHLLRFPTEVDKNNSRKHEARDCVVSWTACSRKSQTRKNASKHANRNNATRKKHMQKTCGEKCPNKLDQT